MRTSKQVPRFVIVGAVSTLLHVSVYTLASRVGLNPVAANVFGFMTAVFCSFLGHYHVSFEVSGRYLEYAGKFALISLAGLAASSAIMQLSISVGMQPFYALLIVVLIVPTISYVLNKFWTFSEHGRLTGINISTLMTTLAIAGLTLWVLDGTQLNHDSSWYLLATARWLNGSELYSDILEINPPLSFYLTAPTVMLAKFFGFEEALVFRLLVVCGATVSALVSTSILKQACELSNTRSLLFAVCASAGLLLSPIPDFGQREHLMLIFSLPLMMLLITAPDREGWIQYLIVPITLVGMLGLALKPHFLLPVALVFAANLFHDRSWKVLFNRVHLTILSALLSYLAFIALVHPGYLGFMVPLGIAVYGYNETDFWSLASEVLPIIGSVLLMYAFTCPSMPRRRVLIRSFAILLGFGLVYLVQFKGWSYQLLPVHAFSIISIGLVLALGTVARKHLGILSALMLVATLRFGLIAQLETGPYRNHIAIFLKRALEDIEGVNSMMFFSTNVSAGFPLVGELGLEWASRFPTLWLIPSIVDHGDPDVCVPGQFSFCSARIPASTFLRESVTDDMIQFDADLVIVDNRTPKPYLQRPFDYIQFMRRDERFQKLWQKFKWVRSAGSYEVWRRIDGTYDATLKPGDVHPAPEQSASAQTTP